MIRSLHLRDDESGVSLIEMLVVMVIFGAIAAMTTSLVITTQNTYRFNQQLAEANDEARIVFERVRKELRAARRVNSGAPGAMEFWVDANVDGLQQPAEIVTWQIQPFPGQPGRFQVIRYTDATGSAGARTLASVLRNNDPFSGFSSPANTTNSVTLRFEYDVDTVRGPQALEVATTVRLRNVA